MSVSGLVRSAGAALRPRLVRATVAVTLAAVTLTGSLAYATWVAPGVGQGASRSVTAGTGNAPTTVATGRNVAVSWATSTYSNGIAVASYLVKRYDAAGTVLQTITTGTCATTVTGTGCTHSAVPSGTWRYSVTPANGNWRGTESAKTAVTVASPSLSLTPVLTRATATLSGTAASFVTGETLTFRLDNPTSGTVLAGTLAGIATPTAVPATGGGAVTVVLPAGTTAGAHTVYAVASTSGENASQAVTVDNTPPPAPSITGSPATATAATTATFTFTDTEPGVTFTCSLDGGTATTCTSGIAYSGLADGSHTFSVRAVDIAGNTSAATTRTWTVDNVAPVSTTTFPAPGATYSTAGYAGGCSTVPADFCGTTSDAATGVSTVRVSIQQATSGRYWNGTAFTPLTETLLTPTGTASWSYAAPSAVVLTEGGYTLRVHTTDAAGNLTTTTSTFAYDKTAPPTPTIDSGPSAVTTSTTATFTFSDSEAGVGFTCAVDGAPATGCTSPVSYSGLTEGAHTFVVTATDVAGNGDSASRTWTVDTTDPSGSITFTTNGGSYGLATYAAGCSTGGGDLCGTASDAVSSVSQVRVSVQRLSTGQYWNGTAFASPSESLLVPVGTTSWSLPLVGTSYADGSYTVRTYVTDAAGNVSTVSSTFTIDATPPPVPTVTVFPSGTTASSTASFTFSDTEAGVGFLCSIDGGAAVACTSPTVYRILANTAHTFSVTAIDAAGNTSAAATKSWTVNAAVPGGALTFPVNGATYNDTTWDAGCSTPAGDICGTAPAGTTAVALSIKQVSTGLFWNGTAFAAATETVVNATGTSAWTYALAAAPDDSYTVRYFVTNAAGHVSQPSTPATYAMTTPPLAYAPSTTNAGTAGKLELGDELVLSTSEALLPSSVLAGWTGSITNVVVRVSDDPGSDTLTIWDSTNTTQLLLGSVDLDDKKWVTGDVTFGLTGTPSTIEQTGSTITVTLGTVSNASDVGTIPGAGRTNMAWTPGVGATDPDGNAFASPATVAESDNDKDF